MGRQGREGELTSREMARALLVLLIAATAAVVSSQELGTGGPEPVVLLEELQALQATNGTAANATEVNATAATPAPPAQNDAKKKEKLKEGMTKAKIQQYLRKIREFQRMKKQRWDPSVEQNLAE